ncbi:MAG: YfcE family phosphodiesterase [Planctomycetaceae bacterium]
MRLGIFADVHDHLDHLRRAVALFNAADCETVLFAGDLVSTFAVPPLRKLQCPFIGCYGDNEGNKPGLQAGFSIVGTLGEAPVYWTSPDGLRFVIVHMERQLRLVPSDREFDIAICGHTHKPAIRTDDRDRLFLNPGEVSGWTFSQPTVMLFDTSTRDAHIRSLLPDVANRDTNPDAVETRMRSGESLPQS